MLNKNERDMLINEMETLLDEYDYVYSTISLNEIIDEWARQKASLIEAFKKHPNYIEGKFLIAFDCDYSREIETQPLRNFRDWLIYNVVEHMVDGLPEDINKQRIEDNRAYLPDDLFWFFDELHHIKTRTIDEELTTKINKLVPNVHAHTGQKTTKVINKLLTYLGYNKHPDYNREFAKYADALSPITIKRHTILSINPLDYLTMSFGNSWASCHTIDKENRRGMPNSYQGQYSSGTMSYMLDPSSMVFYTVDKSYNGTDYWTQPKLIRQMFHWGEEKLVQSRLYPQSNDGDTDVYTPYRNIVQEVMTTILEVPNLWTLSKGCSAASRYIYSYGTHYRDYNHFESCSLSRLKGSENENAFTVGANPICIECGARHEISETINCCRGVHRCAHCGCAIFDEEEDGYWVYGEIYCQDCCSYCDMCGSYHVGESTYIENYRWGVSVCEYCRDEYFVLCADCDEYVHIDDSYITGHDECICRHCFESGDYATCEDCGEVYHTDDLHEYEGAWYCKDCYDELKNEEEE